MYFLGLFNNTFFRSLLIFGKTEEISMIRKDAKVIQDFVKIVNLQVPCVLHIGLSRKYIFFISQLSSFI